MNLSLMCSRVIRWSFYLLFVLVPLLLTPWNYELFEYNKMIITYMLTVIIGGAWIIKMIQEKEIRIAKTPLDIPIALFVISQLVSAIFSMDPHVSWFGYYSRFNGGMLSVLSYVLLFYAFVTNMSSSQSKTSIPETVKKKKHAADTAIETAPIDTFASIVPFLRVMLVSAIVVALYGVAERLGIDKNLWVQDVQNRVFSTLGQPNWLAAYLVALLPLSIAFALNTQPVAASKSPFIALKHLWWIGSAILFFVVLLFTRSRSGLFGFAISDLLLWILIFVSSRKNKQLLPMVAIFHVVLAIIVFFNGSNIAQIDKYFSLEGVKNAFANRKTTPQQPPPPPGYSPPVLEAGGTESGTIRKYVWQGAINAWKSSTKALLIGTGTETFAFAFYKFRPEGHNLTSEWDFLYNKAHNEYLNYLATTGSFGLLSYILFLGTFIVWFTKTSIFSKKEDPAIPHKQRVTQYGLFAGWISILVTNFFGFSVVIIQIFLFLFPALLIALRSSVHGVQVYTKKLKASFPTTPLIVGVVVLMMLLLSSVAALWYADTLYASSYRMARSGQYAQAKLSIEKAIFLNPTEPLYHDEISTTLAAIAVASFEQQNATVASEFAKRSLLENDQAIRTSPQNVNFWKTRTKLYYSFSSLDPKFNEAAIGALEKAGELSPNDAKVYYNLAILYGRQGANDKSIELLKKSIALKPNYHDAYYALYVFYTEIKQPDLGRQILEEYMQKIDPNDQNFAEILGKSKP